MYKNVLCTYTLIFCYCVMIHSDRQFKIQTSGHIMHPILILFVLMWVTPLPVPSMPVPIQLRGLPNLGKIIDFESLMMMMNDEEEGSSFQEIYCIEQPKCPLGCQCHLKIVQCSDLGECLHTVCVSLLDSTNHCLLSLTLQHGDLVFFLLKITCLQQSAEL